MKTYGVHVWNCTTPKKEMLCYIEMVRPYFTKREFNYIVSELFFHAAQTYENANLCAEVMVNGQPEFEVTCKTITDGSVIDSVIRINGQYVRTMNVAS
jgi:hypothetical protein